MHVKHVLLLNKMPLFSIPSGKFHSSLSVPDSLTDYQCKILYTNRDLSRKKIKTIFPPVCVYVCVCMSTTVCNVTVDL